MKLLTDRRVVAQVAQHASTAARRIGRVEASVKDERERGDTETTRIDVLEAQLLALAERVAALERGG